MVQKVKTNSSNELFNNLNDESRVYDIEANVNVAERNEINVAVDAFINEVKETIKA